MLCKRHIKPSIFLIYFIRTFHCIDHKLELTHHQSTYLFEQSPVLFRDAAAAEKKAPYTIVYKVSKKVRFTEKILGEEYFRNMHIAHTFPNRKGFHSMTFWLSTWQNQGNLIIKMPVKNSGWQNVYCVKYLIGKMLMGIAA